MPHHTIVHPTTGEYRIHYRFDGPADRPVVVLAHSLAASSAMWASQMPFLTARFRVLSVDMRGHGGSDAPEGAYHPDGLGEDFRSLLAHLGLESVDFIGLSMGGMIGMTLATAHPGLLRSLVLCDTMCEVPDGARAAFGERVAIARSQGMAALVEPTIGRWFTPAFVAANPPILDAVRADIRNTPVAGYAGCVAAIQALDLRQRIPAIAIPTLVIVGRDDPATPPAASAVIHRAIPGSSMVVLDDASHLSNIEQPEAFDAALAAFYGAGR
ncbi:3-oxoadipate enol-lactonase [Stella humosa]|uniref:3-oxoadipate enol-lactonase n=1 Tax=Stella humosa TaxID=94 RepID=A0A3N1MGW1_9PROT|nr:alpha/beta fold hydrolase [Stella humosa]ROQ01870.1 3-oxoadipate enol-lactonase [Stella humosa]BBK32259.1 3-oxoadipate enol-lactonase [Stella humosa]